jgi:DNA-binding response OmpR family regulator
MSIAHPVPIHRRIIRLPSRPSIRARVLFVSTDYDRTSHWRAVLLRGHFAVTVACADQDIGDLAVRNFVDVIVLDLGDPTFDALALCRDLRATKVAAPILMVHPQGNLDDLLDGFEAGTDAYIYGRVDHTELFSRIDELSRQSVSAAQ